MQPPWPTDLRPGVAEPHAVAASADSMRSYSCESGGNDLHFRREFSNLSRGFKAVKRGHGNVQDHNVRLEISGCLDCRSPVVHRADDLKLRFEQGSETLRHDRVIVNQ